MHNHINLIRTAAKRAMQHRVANYFPLNHPCDVYELIRKQGIALQFVDVRSIEGFYCKEQFAARICVNSNRPSGRQRFTAAHELGHHMFGHGTQFDTILESETITNGTDPNEISADAFARFLLMPPRAVWEAFKLRGVEPQSADATQVYLAAMWLGVGYGTLLNHMHRTMNLISHREFSRLLRAKPKAIKAKLHPGVGTNDLWNLDSLWVNTRLHGQVGDVFGGIQPRRSAVLAEAAQDSYVAVAVGEEWVPLKRGGSMTVSVSRRNYVGLYEYRYMSEPENA